MRNLFLFSLLALVVSCTSQSDPNQSVLRVDNQQWKELIAQSDNNLIVDVRTADEFAAGHIQDAQNIDFFQDDFAAKMNSLDKSKNLFIYCKSGGRSGKTAKMLQDSGFKSIIELKDGYSAWKP